MTTPAIFNRIAGTGNPPIASGDEILTSLNNDVQQLYQLLVQQGGMINGAQLELQTLGERCDRIEGAAVPVGIVEELRGLFGKNDQD